MCFFTSGTRAGDIGCDPPYFKGAERNLGTLLPSIDGHTSLWGPDWVQIDIFPLCQAGKQDKWHPLPHCRDVLSSYVPLSRVIPQLSSIDFLGLRSTTVMDGAMV